jgi:ATP-dependent DNA helicase 2 subunit 1
VKTEPKSEKSQKDTNGDGGITDKEMAEINDRGNISKQSVAALKEFLKSRGVNATGKKLDLVERTQEYLESKGL